MGEHPEREANRNSNDLETAEEQAGGNGDDDMERNPPKPVEEDDTAERSKERGEQSQTLRWPKG